MSIDIKGYRVFIASPSGLQDERKEFRNAVEEFDDSIARPRNVLFEPVGWEDTLGGVGRPQEIINEDLKRCDYFVMILWDRWGANPQRAGGAFTSGTEEELAIATECLNDLKCPMREIVIFFKAVDARQLSDPGEQLQKVLDFRKRIEAEKSHLYHTFDDLPAFRSLLQRFLGAWLLRHEHPSTGAPAEVAIPLDVKEQLLLKTGSVSSAQAQSDPIAHAQRLAQEGLLVDAETEFAKLVEGGSDPKALSAYGRFLAAIGRASQARDVYERLLSLSEVAGQKWAAAAHQGLGDVHLQRGESSQAEQEFRESLRIAEDTSDVRQSAKAVASLGNILRRRGELSAAETLLSEGLSAFEKLNDTAGRASVCNLLGLLHMRRKSPIKATEFFKEALMLYKGINSDAGIAQVNNNLGLIYQEQRLLDEAGVRFREALRINKRIGHPYNAGTNHRNLGKLYGERREWEAAKTELEAAVEIFAGLGLVKRVANTQRLLENVRKKAAEVP